MPPRWCEKWAFNCWRRTRVTDTLEARHSSNLLLHFILPRNTGRQVATIKGREGAGQAWKSHSNWLQGTGKPWSLEVASIAYTIWYVSVNTEMSAMDESSPMCLTIKAIWVTSCSTGGDAILDANEATHAEQWGCALIWPGAASQFKLQSDKKMAKWVQSYFATRFLHAHLQPCQLRLCKNTAYLQAGWWDKVAKKGMHIDSINYNSAEGWHDTGSRLFPSWPTLAVSTVMLLWAWASSLSWRSPMHLPSGHNNSCRIATMTQSPVWHPKSQIMDSGSLWDDCPANLTAMCMTQRWGQACVKLCKTESSLELVVVPAGVLTSVLCPSLVSLHLTIDHRQAWVWMFFWAFLGSWLKTNPPTVRESGQQEGVPSVHLHSWSLKASHPLGGAPWVPEGSLVENVSNISHACIGCS